MKNLLKAIADFQFECPAIKKEKNNDFGKFKYTDLSDVLQVIKPLLQKHGLGFYQITESDTIDELVTVLFHVESGETLESRLKMDLNVELRGMNKYQVMGSAISYSRKYALTAILGIVSDERSIDELKPDDKPKKPKLNDKQIIQLVASIQNEVCDKEGNLITKDYALEKYDLSDQQKTTINSL